MAVPEVGSQHVPEPDPVQQNPEERSRPKQSTIQLVTVGLLFEDACNGPMHMQLLITLMLHRCLCCDVLPCATHHSAADYTDAASMSLLRRAAMCNTPQCISCNLHAQ
jgi:hypothetical protein